MFTKKKKLVPFTETSPALFKPFNLFKLSNIEFTTGPKKVAASSISVNICYELLFGNLVSQNCYESGGQVLASISNEYWIEGASELLVGIGSIRAIENRKFLIRSTNNGIATLINPNGEVLQHFRSKKAISSIKGHVIPNNYQTFYMRNQEIISVIPVGLFAILLVVILFSHFFTKTEGDSLHSRE